MGQESKGKRESKEERGQREPTEKREQMVEMIRLYRKEKVEEGKSMSSRG